MLKFDDQVLLVAFILFWPSSLIFGILTLNLKFYLSQNSLYMENATIFPDSYNFLSFFYFLFPSHFFLLTFLSSWHIKFLQWLNEGMLFH